MPASPQALIARLRRTARPRDESDGVILTRFAQQRDPEAFALLVRRFGPMVLGVCRRALGDTPDADDAYQATFLVLVRKARTVRPPEAVGSWLFAVAHRTAVYARTAMIRRSAKLRPLDREPVVEPPESSDLLAALDAELAVLPDRFRDAVVLCELHGRSLKDAAAAVGVPVGTLASRLARGRQMLADRLKAKGFVVPAAVVSSLLAASAATAAPEFDPLAPAAGSTQLADGVMKMALLSKLKLTTAATLAALTVGVFGLLPGTTPPAAHAAPVPKADGKLSEPQVKEFDQLWQDMVQYWRPEASRAALGFIKHPGPAATYLKTKLKPLKLDEKEAKRLIAQLADDDENVWKEAEAELLHRHPLLALSLPDAWAEAKTTEQKSRLAVVLLGGKFEEHDKADWELAEQPGNTVNPFVLLATPKPGQQLKGAQPGRRVIQNSTGIEESFAKLNDRRPTWHRDRAAVLILEHIGTPEAVKMIEAMAGGHPEASPTVAAKEALARLRKK
jgi:RNA polymerase sigma factor (sigma-70 family)